MTRRYLTLILLACSGPLQATPKIEAQLPPPQPSEAVTVSVHAQPEEMFAGGVATGEPSEEVSTDTVPWIESARSGAAKIIAELAQPADEENRALAQAADFLDRLVVSNAGGILLASLLCFGIGLFGIAIMEQLRRPRRRRSRRKVLIRETG